jgi:phytanoyl-CoA hydroxylase
MAIAQEPPARFDEFAAADYDDGLYRCDTTAEYVETLSAVTPADLDRYRAQGYLAIRRAFTPAEVAAGIDGLLHLIDGGNPAFDGVQFEASVRDRLATLRPEEKQDVVRKLMWFVEFDPRLKALSAHPSLLDVLRPIIGGEPTMFQDMALLKPPGVGREKPWHQDKAFFTISLSAPVVGVWIALDPATPENGCMHVIPGSHQEGPVIHFRRRDWQICDSDVQGARDVMVPLPPGGCLLFDGLIHHGTPANRTNTRRRAVQFHYTSPDAAWLDEEYRMRHFGSAGKDVTC